MPGYRRADLQRLAESKLEDARLLLVNQRWFSAYYLAGYAVEFGLKACIARQFAADTIPELPFVKEVYTHDLEKLAKHAGLATALRARGAASPRFAGNWATVLEWSESVRYMSIDSYSASLMLVAVGDPERWGFGMAEAALVGPNLAASQRFLELLDREGLGPRAAVWVYGPDQYSWKLWIVPPDKIKNKQEFYLKLASVFSRNIEKLDGLDFGSVQFTSRDHPAIIGLARLIHAPGLVDVRFEGNLFDGFYLPDAIVVRMDVERSTP